MEIDITNLHHAYLIESAPDTGERFLQELFKKIDFNKMGNPDYYEWKGSSFSITDARLLKEKAHAKAFGKKKIFVIVVQRMNLEAQNALLKTLEEPIENMHFFIILPKRDDLLPTLLSRIQVVHLNEGGLKNDEAEDFLGLPPPARLGFVKRFVDQERPLASFLDLLSSSMKKKGLSQHEIKKVFILREFANDPAVSPRLLLEHLALVLK